jgi:hypothetical protein
MKPLAGMLRMVATLVVVAGAPLAHAGSVLDAAGGNFYVTWTDGSRTIDFVQTPGAPWVAVEIVARTPSAQPVLEVSHSGGALAVHSGAGGTAPLTTSVFRSGGPAVPNPSYVLRDPRNGLTTAPESVRTVALDPAEPSGSTVLLGASHVLLPRTNQVHVLALLQRASGEAVLLDYAAAGGPPRRTPLGFTPPIGSNKGSFVAAPNGSVWAAFASTDGIRLYDLGDLSAPGALQAQQRGAVSVGEGFRPESTRLGIIAILIGLLATPAPVVTYQYSLDMGVATGWEGTSARTLAHVPTGALGLAAADGTYIFTLPYLEQDNLWKGVAGFGAPQLVLALP